MIRMVYLPKPEEMSKRKHDIGGNLKGRTIDI